ncbi:MAG: lamin tail domain-containing protein [Opitutaceae bacterium]|nr:lamin tail domain-containing protein [Opitutaceae bacterium]
MHSILRRPTPAFHRLSSQRCRLPLAAGTALLLLLGTAVPAAPVINEIMYRPGTGYPENTALEFIELHNPDATAIDLSGWAITAGAAFTFPAGTSLPAGGYLVVASNPTALATASGLAAGSIAGPWQAGATLANRGETVTLSRPGATAGSWIAVDTVDYADEGDWATRTRDALGGWSWVSPASSGGRSLERRNPGLASTNGQNWGPSNAAGGTPGAANSLRAANVAPVITGVRHSPAVPTSTDAVTITCTITDESTTTPPTATLYWRIASVTTPGDFQAVAMAGDRFGLFTAVLPAMADKTIVEFYVAANDGTLTRTWPAPSSEGQNTNCTYQVDNEVVAGSAPVYRLVLTAAENAAFTTYTAGGAGGGGGGGPAGGIGDRQFNFTLVVSRGTDTTIRYLTSMRVRGNSSRSYTIKPLRISMPTDQRWDGVSDFVINSRGAPVQLLAHRIQRAAGIVSADASPIEVRRQGVEYTVTTGATADHGQLVRIEEIDGDYVDNHWPAAVSGQVYRKVSISNWSYTATAPANPDLTWSGWSKQNNRSENDWSDVMNFTKTWQDTAAPYFTGGSAGNVAAGTWNGTAFSDADLAKLSEVADLDYLARWLAVMTIIPNAEENLSTGEDDDYAAAFIRDGTRTRFYPVPHDMDTTFGLGEVTTTATAKGLYDATEIGARTGNFADTMMEPLLPLLGDSTRNGHPAFREKYLNAIRELFGSVFDADTTGNANPPFHQFVDNHLGWTPASYRAQIKTFMTQRQSHLLGLIGAGKIAPTAPTSTPTLAAAGTPTLRINEVLAANTKLANGATFPDLIELHNAGATAIDLTGRSLTDDPATPRKYVFPSGTTIAAGGYLVVYADADASAPGLHAGFSLDAEGDEVRLYDTTAAGGGLLDAVTFGFQIPDFSVGRTGSGGTWALLSPTPGAANGSAPSLGSLGAVKLNEWAGNIGFRVDHDFIELHNSAAQPVALGGASLTDDAYGRPRRFVFPALSFIPAGGFVTLFGEDFGFGLDGDFDFIHLLGENGAIVDQVDLVSQPADRSTARSPDGGPTYADLAVPTPGLANTTALPAAYSALLNQLRITEVMYQPTAAASAGDYEFIELQNIGTTPLDLGGVRFTNGLDYTFPAGTTLGAGAFVVVARNRAAFTTRYPSAAASLAPGAFTGALDNSGENIALTLPAPWYVHILKFRYESTWSELASGSGYSLVVRNPSLTLPQHFDARTTWRASAAVNGNPGAPDTGGLSVAAQQTGTVTVAAGHPLRISVAVTTDGFASYQWQRLTGGQWIDVAGATGAAYSVASTQGVNGGTYRAVVTANGLTATSDPVVVAVDATTSTAARLLNLSTRGRLQNSNDPLIPGFVISGTGTRRLLVRAVGPTLASFGVGGTLADPQLALKRYDPASGAYVDVVANDNWGTAADAGALASTTVAVGAFALATASADAALLVDLPAGQYSAVASGAGSGTGVTLVELYDHSGGTQARLANLATRGYVGTGGDVLISGFVVSSEGAKTLLIRAVGPTLSSFGVTGTLADPQLTVFGRAVGASTDSALLSNDDWNTGGDGTAVAAVAAQVGAFALPAGSKDAAMVVTLPPGNYTVQASGTNNTTGAALIEIYVVP